jgi:succinate-semialdehyde dehydrogenase/glutarate-semialdehyde dehydrogenase
MIVAGDADIAKALQAAVIGRFRNCGQTCSAVKRLYVDTQIYDEFVGRLVPLVERLVPGNGLEPAPAPFVRMGPLHSSEQLTKIEAQLHDAVSRGAEVLTGGRRSPRAECSNGHFFDPTVVANVPNDSRLVREEVFGPVLPVFRTSGIEDAIEKANASDWDLNASLWTGDRTLARAAGRRIRCRQLWVNRLPFGLNLRDSQEVTAERHLSD